jgi:tetrapyrrole methylase family protein/MazG family protein
MTNANDLTDAELQAYRDLRAIVARLRAPDGCPWDREQTHASLRPYLLQETYEVLAALDDADPAALAGELGDLLWQVLIHTQLAEEAGDFAMTDVLRGVADKLVRRHPHVFGDSPVKTAKEVVGQWEELKRREQDAPESALDSVPEAMPALALAQESLRRAAATGFAWPRREDVIAKAIEEARELAEAPDPARRQEEFGDLLLNLVNYARYLDIDAEDALRLAARKFRRRFRAVETAARNEARPLKDMPIEELLARWESVKASETDGRRASESETP